jgi:hypothetical protein
MSRGPCRTGPHALQECRADTMYAVTGEHQYPHTTAITCRSYRSLALLFVKVPSFFLVCSFMSRPGQLHTLESEPKPNGM